MRLLKARLKVLLKVLVKLLKARLKTMRQVMRARVPQKLVDTNLQETFKTRMHKGQKVLRLTVPVATRLSVGPLSHD